MAEQIIEQIKSCLNHNKNFVVYGGAGSGKTYSLLQTIDYIYSVNKKNTICCVTYTNAAVNEIKNRCPYSNLKVATIHDTLWDLISPYKKNLLEAFQDYLKLNHIDLGDNQFSIKEIYYRQYKKYEEGIISHEEVLWFANYMFHKYSLLRKILADKYKYFLIDEFQDTCSELIDIVIETSLENCMVVGLFGDVMQSIYENYKSDIPLLEKLHNNNYMFIKKEDNFRCSIKVISLINKLRLDDIIQSPANNNKEGNVKFVFSNRDLKLNEIKNDNCFSEWNWNDEKNTKELFLTHKLISKETGFDNYLNAFNQYPNTLAIGKKEDERHPITNCLFRICEIIELYNKKDYATLLKKINKKIKQNDDKIKLKEILELLLNNKDNNCLEVIDDVKNSGLLQIGNIFDDMSNKTQELIKNLNNVKFREAFNAYQYSNEKTPFSTQHNIKGLQFENVFILLDNARWNNYNFVKLFSDDKSNCDLYERTLKLFYVCCSRSKSNLFIYFPKPNSIVLQKANLLFGKENLIEIY